MKPSNTGAQKLGKLFSQLKKDFVFSQRILTGLLSPSVRPRIRYQTLNKGASSAHRTEIKLWKYGNLLVSNKLAKGDFTDVKAKSAYTQRNIFGKIVGFAKDMVNSKVCYTALDNEARKIVFLINNTKNECGIRLQRSGDTALINARRIFNEGLYWKELMKSCSCLNLTSFVRNTSTDIKTSSRIKPSYSFSLHMPEFSTQCTPSKSSGCGRDNYHVDVECAINEQILSEFNACYAYLSMACYFGRTDIALPGSYGFFMRMHEEEHGHALKFIKYQNLRGGNVKLCAIVASKVEDWVSITNALEVSLAMEKLVKEKLVAVHDIAEKHHDLGVMDMIASEYIQEQDRSICEFGRLITRSKKMEGCGCPEFLFDREMHKAFVKKHKEGDAVYV